MSTINFNKILAFDVWADYAHFRKFYTTTSPLTFSVPPRTALCGLIGAIVGLSKIENEYLDYFSLEEVKIGIRILRPISKTMIAQNLIHTKNARGPGMNLIKQRTQIRFEYLKNPKYRIYFAYCGSNENLLSLKSLLETHKSVYTPVLGLSENIANFKFHGEFNFNFKKVGDGYISINTAIPLGQVSEEYGTKFDYDAEYFSERHPLMLTRERVVTKYDDILFERNGKPIEVKLKTGYFELSNGEGNIVFLE
jgi:CRISPR-associated protein Cas5h